MSAPVASSAPWRRIVLGTLCVVAALMLAAIGLGHEQYLSTQGDMPRYIMNGTFMFDLLRDRPFHSIDALREYATLYYARYPALSLGHHPPLVSVLDVPFFAVFGVSVTTARLPVILSFGVAVLYLFRLVTELYDEWAGTAAALALAFSPVMVELGQGVMSEPPAIALAIVAAYYLHRFCETGAKRALALFVLAAGASVWAKQLVFVAYPGYAAYAVARLGWRRLLERDAMWAMVALVLIAGPIVPITMVMSPFNTRIALSTLNGAAHAHENPHAGHVVQTGLRVDVRQFVSKGLDALRAQLTAGIAVLGFVGLAAMVLRRRDEAWLFGCWFLATAGLVYVMSRNLEVVRYSVYWVPPLAAAAGTLCAGGRWQRLLAVIVAIALVPEAVAAVQTRLPGAAAYEVAAQYVVEHPRGATVLFDGDVDTGYFIFFVRKHDAARKMIVVRSDKLFTTSELGNVDSERRIDDPSQIRPNLKRLGVGYVVIEDRPSASKVLEWLRSDVHSAAYVERLRVPSGSGDFRLRGTDLVVYELTGDTSPQPDARLDMHLPLVSRQLNVSLADLLARKGLR